MTLNEEILIFANWWICSKYRPGWDEKREEFLSTVNEFEKNSEIKVVVVDQFKKGNIESLRNLPYYTPGHKVCCIYKEKE